jgi:NADH dehydrogenase
METPKYPQGHPQVANVAINQGKISLKISKKFRKRLARIRIH